MTLDSALPLIAAILAAPLTLLLIVRRVSRTLPTYVAYQAYTFVTGLAAAWADSYAPAVYRYFWAPCICLDLIFYICVLIELSRSVLLHNRAGNSRRPIAILVFPLMTLLFWSLAPWPVLPKSDWIWQLNLRSLQATGVLQMSGLVTLVLCSSWQKLRWPERELHVLTGIGIWVPVQFVVLIIHTHGFFGGRYHWLDLLGPACCIFATAYWLHYFWLEPAQSAVPGGQDLAEIDSTRRAEGVDPCSISRVM